MIAEPHALHEQLNLDGKTRMLESNIFDNSLADFRRSDLPPHISEAPLDPRDIRANLYLAGMVNLMV